MKVSLQAESEEDTRVAGRRLAALIRSGDVVVLAGTLGSGKTLFTSGLAEGLGITRRVTSPTFVLVRRYDDGFLPLVHADAYRLSSRSEFADLDLLEEARDSVLVVEWGHVVEDLLPEDHLVVAFEVTGPHSRTLEFQAHGNWTDRPLHELVS